MKKITPFNIIIGVLLIIYSLFFCKTFLVSISIFLISLLNLFIGFGGVEWILDKYEKNKKN